MGNGDIKNMKVREGDLKRARRIQFEERFCDWKIFNALVSFCEECPKEFKKWQQKKDLK